MRATVCHKGTVRTAVRYISLAMVLASAATAQSVNWRRVGGPAVELMLASPATGPVDNVWFATDGRLFAHTRTGKTFETADFEIWTPSARTVEPSGTLQPQVARKPEPDSQVIAASFGRMFALGRNLFRSDDSGLSWNNLTGYRGDSVIGAGQHSVAVGPGDQLVVANDFGVWRSMDGGLSWNGLNLSLPNLPVRRILSTPQGTTGVRVAADGIGAMELHPGSPVWTPVSDNSIGNEAARLRDYSRRQNADIRSYAAAGSYVYLGTSDGRVLVSVDSGITFTATATMAAGAVEKIFTDAERPFVALAAVAGPTGPHVLHTINGGGFW